MNNTVTTVEPTTNELILQARLEYFRKEIAKTRETLRATKRQSKKHVLIVHCEKNGNLLNRKFQRENSVWAINPKTLTLKTGLGPISKDNAYKVAAFIVKTYEAIAKEANGTAS